MKVKIKTWSEMEKEFGLDEVGDINCEYSFVDIMENNLPEDRIIETVKDDDGDPVWFTSESSGWNISNDMIKEKL